MTKPFWIAAVTGVLVTAVVVNQWAESRTEAAVFVAVLLWTVGILAIIDVVNRK